MTIDAISHKIAAKEHFKVAEEYNLKLKNATPEEKKGIRVVAAQNYFYCAINMIEAIFAEKLEQHSFSHENRHRKIIENRKLFSDEIVKLYEKVDREERNRVAYRGENGKRYENIRRLAEILVNAK